MQRSLGTRSSYVAVVMAALLLLAAGCAEGTSGVTSRGPLFCTSDSQGPSFNLSSMPGFMDLVPDTEPVNLTLRLTVGVTDPDGVDSVIGSYRNSSQIEWTNVTMSEDLSYNQSGIYIAEALNYTTPAGGFNIVWQYVFYANDSLGNWNQSAMGNMSVARQVGPSTFDNVTGVVVGSALILAEIAIAALCYVRYRK